MTAIAMYREVFPSLTGHSLAAMVTPDLGSLTPETAWLTPRAGHAVAWIPAPSTRRSLTLDTGGGRRLTFDLTCNPSLSDLWRQIEQQAGVSPGEAGVYLGSRPLLEDDMRNLPEHAPLLLVRKVFGG
ncbi:uncharacterized protein LOC144592290 [Rhinoraja longicauda]